MSTAKPCATCPFRRGSRAADMPGGFDVGHAAEVDGDGGFGSPMLTCHSREPGIDALCAGWLNDQKRNGVSSIPLRLALIAGRAELPAEVDEGLLTYEEMLTQMRRDPTAKRRRSKRKDPARENYERVMARLRAAGSTR